VSLNFLGQGLAKDALLAGKLRLIIASEFAAIPSTNAGGLQRLLQARLYMTTS
jgi:hypothetical protein